MNTVLRDGVKFTTAQDALDKLHLGPVTNPDAFDISGVEPENIKNHFKSSDYVMLGITPKEVSALFGGVPFDFLDLEAQFQSACGDYKTVLGWTTKSYALDFACRVAYSIGPESRQVKKPGSDRRWKFRFCTVDKDGLLSVNVVFVCTFKNTELPNVQPKFEHNKLVLTLKQASLLALTTLAQIIPLCVENESLIMTPLAGAIFSKSDITKIAEEIFGKAKPDNTNISDVLKGILQSCQSGGQYLAHSKCHIAVVAALCATRNMKDKKLRMSIIGKTYKQYVSAGKVFEKPRFAVYCKYATGGIPAEFSPDKLIDYYESVSGVNYKMQVDLAKTTFTSASTSKSGNA